MVFALPNQCAQLLSQILGQVVRCRANGAPSRPEGTVSLCIFGRPYIGGGAGSLGLNSLISSVGISDKRMSAFVLRTAEAVGS